MRERAQELKAESARTRRAEGETDVLATIAAMEDGSRHGASGSTPSSRPARRLSAPRTWYGMPAYSKDGKVVCFFKNAAKFKSRYATFGFEEAANLDEGHVADLLRAEEADRRRRGKDRALVKKAVS